MKLLSAYEEGDAEEIKRAANSSTIKHLDHSVCSTCRFSISLLSQVSVSRRTVTFNLFISVSSENSLYNLDIFILKSKLFFLQFGCSLCCFSTVDTYWRDILCHHSTFNRQMNGSTYVHYVCMHLICFKLCITGSVPLKFIDI